MRTLLDTLLADAGGRPIVLKEPRINGLLTLWGNVIDGTLNPVLALRDPIEVARSLATRDGTSIPARSPPGRCRPQPGCSGCTSAT